MEKPAHSNYPIHDLIKQRWSPRAFSDRMVEPEKIKSLLEAARWSASCNNEQPWRFIIATKNEPQEFERLVECLNENNRKWAPHAPVLMLGVAKKTFTKNGRDNYCARYDIGLAVGTMLVQATDLGLFVHQMGGIDRDKAREIHHIPDDYEPIAMIAVGYMGNLNDLPEELQIREKAPRERKALADFVFSGDWAQSAPLVSDS